jgi:CubicO group peptidase (beta-lactamase class C family)
LGFDKPEKPNGTKDNGPTTRAASASSFGHTGFTGTYAWLDPEHNLVYIFLSNRTYPDAENKKLLKENIRTDIQKVIYEALEKVN